MDQRTRNQIILAAIGGAAGGVLVSFVRKDKTITPRERGGAVMIGAGLGFLSSFIMPSGAGVSAGGSGGGQTPPATGPTEDGKLCPSCPPEKECPAPKECPACPPPPPNASGLTTCGPVREDGSRVCTGSDGKKYRVERDDLPR